MGVEPVAAVAGWPGSSRQGAAAAVARGADQRVAGHRQVYPDLMRPPRRDAHLDERRWSAPGENAHVREGGLSRR